VQVKLLHEEVAFALIVLVFEQLHSLSQVAKDVLDFPLALPIVNYHLNANLLIRVVENLVDLGVDLHVVLRREAVEATLALDVTLEVEILRGETFDTLLFNLIFFVDFHIMSMAFSPLFHIGNSLRLKKLALVPTSLTHPDLLSFELHAFWS